MPSPSTQKGAPLGPHPLFRPFLSRFSALRAAALAIASDLPGLSPGPPLLGLSISSQCNHS